MTNLPTTASTYLTFTDVQRRYAFASRGWIYARIASGDLPAPLRLGGRLLWHKETLDKWDRELADRQLAAFPNAGTA
jgi:predicted DNA-binding transcriptional regulator AlpA